MKMQANAGFSRWQRNRKVEMMAEETHADFNPDGEDEVDYGDGELSWGPGETGDDPNPSTTDPGLGIIYEHGDEFESGEGDQGGTGGMDPGQESMSDPDGE